MSSTAKGRLQARYSEALPTGPDHAVGLVSTAGRSLFIDLVSPAAAGDRAFLSLFMPQAPASCLGGLYCSATLISPNPEPSCSRLLAVRVPPGESATIETGNRYMEPGESVALDLTRHGIVRDDLGRLDAVLPPFLEGGRAGGIDQVEAASYADLADYFDRNWIDAHAATGNRFQHPSTTPAHATALRAASRKAV
jgi:hypothetical protein